LTQPAPEINPSPFRTWPKAGADEPILMNPSDELSSISPVTSQSKYSSAIAKFEGEARALDSILQLQTNKKGGNGLPHSRLQVL
jgi:hypothetical protein